VRWSMNNGMFVLKKRECAIKKRVLPEVPVLYMYRY
jgi:hypothetical protein